MKFKVGDKVRVRNDLVENKHYYMEDRSQYNTVVDVMLALKGRVVTINSADKQYLIEECGYLWTDEMFEPSEICIESAPKDDITDKSLESYEVDTGKLFELLDK